MIRSELHFVFIVTFMYLSYEFLCVTVEFVVLSEKRKNANVS